MFRFLSVLLCLVSLTACTIRPATDYNVDQDFSQYKDFAFAPLAEDAVLSIDEQRIQAELVKQLQNKGLQAVELEQADMLVAYRIDEATELEAIGGNFTFGMGSRHGMIGVSSPDRYKERKYGKLVVEFIDPKAKSLIWRSISQSKLGETMGPERRAEFIQKQLGLMLESYPPKPEA